MSETPTLLGLTVLVVEDEPHVRQHIADALAAVGLNVRTALERPAIFAALREQGCDAVVLDLGLPGDDGVDITRTIRSRHSVPILILTGRSTVSARVGGLEAGADDYLIKPFAPEELQARVRALLRRSLASDTSGSGRTTAMTGSLRIGGSTIDCASGTASGPRGRQLLTERELRLLLALAAVRGPLSREATYREIFRRAWDPDDRSLDVHIANLRRKLSRIDGGPPVIGTVRGFGYELRVPATFMK